MKKNLQAQLLVPLPPSSFSFSTDIPQCVPWNTVTFTSSGSVSQNSDDMWVTNTWPGSIEKGIWPVCWWDNWKGPYKVELHNYNTGDDCDRTFNSLRGSQLHLICGTEMTFTSGHRIGVIISAYYGTDKTVPISDSFTV